MITDKLNKSEVKVLQVLQESKINNEMLAIKISNLAELTGLSYFSVRNIIKSLYIAGLCCKGRKDAQAETYFLSTEGQKLVWIKFEEWWIMDIAKAFTDIISTLILLAIAIQVTRIAIKVYKEK